MSTQTIDIFSSLPPFIKEHPWVLAAVLVWSAVWKLLALWKAAKKDHLTIFIVIGVLNTVGILEIIYLLVVYLKDKKAKSTN